MSTHFMYMYQYVNMGQTLPTLVSSEVPKQVIQMPAQVCSKFSHGHNLQKECEHSSSKTPGPLCLDKIIKWCKIVSGRGFGRGSFGGSYCCQYPQAKAASLRVLSPPALKNPWYSLAYRHGSNFCLQHHMAVSQPLDSGPTILQYESSEHIFPNVVTL